MKDRIMTLHPQGKRGVNIEQAKYEMVRDAIVGSLAEYGELSFRELATEVERRLSDQFEGSITWYVTTVKLDMEARGLLERVEDADPQRLRLKQ
jgi:hypothetical protein